MATIQQVPLQGTMNTGYMQPSQVPVMMPVSASYNDGGGMLKYTIIVLVLFVIILGGYYAYWYYYVHWVDETPLFPWGKVYPNTNWVSGTQKDANGVSKALKGVSIPACQEYVWNLPGAPGFTYYKDTSSCNPKNSFGQGSKKPNNPRTISMVR